VILVCWLRDCRNGWKAVVESSRREKADWERVNATLARAVREGRFEYWRPIIEKDPEE
jgi:hypothetical protein